MAITTITLTLFSTTIVNLTSLNYYNKLTPFVPNTNKKEMYFLF